MRKLLTFLGLLGCFTAAGPPAQVPQAEIRNQFLQVRLYLPDARQGYYRGTRFDWSGVVASMQYRQHQYFGQWFEQYSPTRHDAITGPVEEFAPLGFEQARAGQVFVKVGVGTLLRPDAAPYAFSKTYQVVDPGKWTVRQQSDRVKFVHELSDGAGYAYRYEKVLRLVKGKPQLVLEHRLKNTGQKVLATHVYNHNFFVIDQEPTGPGIAVKFPFQVQDGGRGMGELAVVDDKQITYRRQLQKGEHVYSSGLTGFGNSARDYDLRIENLRSGAGVRITGDRPLMKLVYWASATTSCPEPYIQLQVAPGQEVSWKIMYACYTFPPTAN